ncbi:MAG: hypothetical protein HWE39_15715 [Oceanospirillaceae bacterium]|nr:hypothetical protein [Oceanospirillaceae bacterium]
MYENSRELSTEEMKVVSGAGGVTWTQSVMGETWYVQQGGATVGQTSNAGGGFVTVNIFSGSVSLPSPSGSGTVTVSAGQSITYIDANGNRLPDVVDEDQGATGGSD